ncbi:MAG: PIN domain-containing protein [Kiritimatiellae bacterium]|nr:PIN domain-containing protein [Kiritimatiellia bacterium]
MFDLNVLLDVLQWRTPWARASGELCARAVRGELDGVVAPHAVTTLFYVIDKHADHATATKDIDWILRSFSLAPSDLAVFLRARALAMPDFEDAVVAAAAESARCDVVLTRNLPDFAGSPVPAVAPEEFLASESAPPQPVS